MQQIDFIINQKTSSKNSLIIAGTATTNSWDKGSLYSKKSESLTITPNAIKQAWKEKSQGFPVLVDHGKGKEFGANQVGKWLSYVYEPSDYSLDSPNILKMKVKVICEITDSKAIQMIKENKLNCFSLSWKTLNWLVNEKTGQRIDTEIEITELTLTANPANPEATFTVVTDDSLLEQFNFNNETRLKGKKVKVDAVLENAKMFYAGVIIDNQKSLIPIQDLEISKKIKFNYKVLDKSQSMSLRAINKLKIMYPELQSKILEVVKTSMTSGEVTEITDLTMKILPPTGTEGLAEFKANGKVMKMKVMINDGNMELGDIEQDEIVDENPVSAISAHTEEEIVEEEIVEEKTVDMAETANKNTSNTDTDFIENTNKDSEKSSNVEEIKNAKTEEETTPTVENLSDTTETTPTAEIENAKTARSFEDLVNSYGYMTALKIQQGTISI